MTEQVEKILLEGLMGIRSEIGRIGEIVRRHDDETFPEIQKSLGRIESKHNQDFLQYIDTKEALEERIVPLEEDYEERQKVKEEKEELVMEGKKGAVSNVVSAIIGGLIALGGYLLGNS